MSATAVGTPSVPSTSHYKRRRSRNKKADQRDAFLSLSDDAVADAVHAIRCSTPAPSSSDTDALRSTNLFSDLVLTPLRVISFVLSLCIVEAQQRRWRSQQHASADPSTRWCFSNPDPYREASGTTWHQHLHLSWRRRGIAKMQMTETLEISRRVGVALAAWSMLALLACVYAIRQIYFWLPSGCDGDVDA